MYLFGKHVEYTLYYDYHETIEKFQQGALRFQWQEQPAPMAERSEA